MSTEFIVGTWREVRNGLINEAELIPPDKYSFRATDQTRSVAEVLQHIIESQKLLVGEATRPDTNLKRASFADLIKLYAADVSAVSDKDGLINLLRASMDAAETALRAAGDELNKTMNRFDGKEIVKSDFVRFAIAHEMYHRGQLTVYERLLEIEPAMTKVFKRIFASPPQTAGSSAT